MKNVSRLLTVVFLIGFVAGTLVYVTNAVAMTLDMTAMIGGAAGMTDCDDCADDANAPVCDIACIGPMWAAVDAGVFVQPSLAEELQVWLAQVDAGRAVPPDPYPPKALILS